MNRTLLTPLALLLFVGCTSTHRPAHVAAPRHLDQALSTPTRMRLHVIDVGQGSATLFEFPCAAVLVDTGGEATATFDSNRALRDYLDHFFARRTDLKRTLAAVFITHPHLDHTRGLPQVMADYTVSHLITNGLPRGVQGVDYESGGEQQELAEAQARQRGALRTVARAEIQNGKGLTDAHIDPVQCGDVDPTLELLWGGQKDNLDGWEPKTFSNANNHSLVLRVGVAGHSVLITGDLEVEAIRSLLAAHGETLNSDVLIVGHHGSHNGTTPGLVKAVSPCMAVVSMGNHHRQEDWTAWAYGHPRKTAVQQVASGLGCSRVTQEVEVATGQRRFEAFTLNTALYGTGWEGTVVLDESERGTWKAATER